MHVLANGDIVDCGRLPATARNNLYKTELCKHFTETGTCRYGTKCQFAHGEEELRGVLRHPKYKTTKCKAYMSTGKCMYGSRCRFIHADAAPEETLSTGSVSSTASESDDHNDVLRDLTVNPYGNGLEPIDLSIPFGGLKQVTLTPLTSIGSSVASPTGLDGLRFRDPFAEFKFHLDAEHAVAAPPLSGSSSVFEGFETSSTCSETESVASKFSRLSIFQRICRESD